MLSKKARYSLVALAALVTVVALLAALGWHLISSAPSPRATVLPPTATGAPSSPIAVSSPAAIPEPISVYRGNVQRTGLVSGHGVSHLTGVAWQKQIGQAGFSSPVYADGAIYLGTNTGDLLALDAESGEQRWAFTSVGGNAGPAAIAGDLVYVGLGDVGSSGMGLYALNRRTGNQEWAFQTERPIWLTSPLLYDGKVYFGDQAGVLYAVDIASHREVWRVETQRSIYWNAAADNGLVYFTAMGVMYAVDARTGRQQWQKTSGADWAPLAVADGVIYAGALDQQFYALDARTGDTLWTFQDTPTNRANWSAPAIADGAVYAGNRTGYMYAFEAKTGKQIWKFKADAPPTSDPLLAEGVLYFGVGSHGNSSPEQDRRNVYALNARTGVLRWRLELQGEVYNGPALDARHVYFLTAAGLLYALH